MKLITRDNAMYLHETDVKLLDKLRNKALKVRLSILKYNRHKDANSLNSCCRNCNEIIKLIDILL